MKHLIRKHQRTSKSKRSISLLALPALLSLGLVPSVAPAADPSYTFKAVAYLGDSVGSGDSFVNDFEPTLISDTGIIAFTADTTVPGQEATYLAYPNGTIIQMMRWGQPAPGGGTFSTFELGNIGLNNFGEAAFAFTLEPLSFGPPIYGGVYRWSHVTRTLSPVLLPNVTADPNGGVFVGADFNASLNDFGALLFAPFVTNGTAGLTQPNLGFVASFVQSANGHLHTIARPGQPAPDGGIFTGAGNTQVLNGIGDVLFAGETTLDPTPDNYKLYLRHALSGKIDLLPLPSGVIYEASIALNNFGQVAYGAASVPFSVAEGIGAVYFLSGGVTKVIAQTGGPAPGGGTFSFITGVSIQENLSMNSWGDIVFEAATSTGDEAMYLYSGASKKLRRLAGIGTVIPGVGTIVSLEQAGLVYPPPPTSGFPLCGANINDLRQVCFAATVVSGTTARGVLLRGTPSF